MEISIFFVFWCNAFGNISPIHVFPLIPVTRLQRRVMTFQGWLLLQAAGLGTQRWSQQWMRQGCSGGWGTPTPPEHPPRPFSRAVETQSCILPLQNFSG